jgi:hypothetical protein
VLEEFLETQSNLDAQLLFDRPLKLLTAPSFTYTVAVSSRSSLLVIFNDLNAVFMMKSHSSNRSPGFPLKEGVFESSLGLGL